MLKVLEAEGKYFRKSLIVATMGAMLTLVVLASVGIWAVLPSGSAESTPEPDRTRHLNAVASLFSDNTYEYVRTESVNAFRSLEQYIKQSKYFYLKPPLGDSFESVSNASALYFNKLKVELDNPPSQNIAEFFKEICASDVLVFQRIDKAGDMMLKSSSLDKLPSDFDFRFIGNHSSPMSMILQRVFKGQTAYSTLNMDGTVFSFAFRSITNRSGYVVGMIAVRVKISGVKQFDIFNFAEQTIVFDNATGRVVFQKSQNHSITDSLYRSFSRFSQNPSGFQELDPNCFVSYSNENINWTVFGYSPSANRTSFSEIKPLLFKLLVSCAIFVGIIFTFIIVLSSAKFDKKLETKNKQLNDMLDSIIQGHFREVENSFVEELHQSSRSNSSITDIRHKLSAINRRLADLENDKSDIQDILYATGEKILAEISRFDAIKDETRSNIDSASEIILDVTVRTTQMKNILSDLSIWESFQELASKLRIDDSIEKLSIVAQSLSTKSGIINDKVDKVFSEIASLKTTADQAYLVSINSAIFAEKASSGKLSMLSEEVRRISEQISNIIDQSSYLLSETRNATTACREDMEKLFSAIQAAPRQKDISEMILEFSRYNDKVSSITKKFENISDEAKQIVKYLEAGKSECDKSNNIVNSIKYLVNF